MTDYTKIAPPWISSSQDRCQIHAVLAAAELIRAILSRPYIGFGRNWLDAMCRLHGISWPPPWINDVLTVVTQTGMVPDSAWPASNYPATADPPAAVTALASAYRLTAAVPGHDPLTSSFNLLMSYDVAAGKAHLDAGHPLVVSGPVYSNWQSGMPEGFVIPAPVGSPVYAHAWCRYGYDDTCWIIREPRSPNFLREPFTYPAAWLAITDCIEAAAVDPKAAHIAAERALLDQFEASA